MTKKDYELIVKSINRTRRDLLQKTGERTMIESAGGCVRVQWRLSELFDQAIVTLIDDLAKELQAENPRFDLAKALQAENPRFVVRLGPTPISNKHY